jgi:hypothetical protein
MEIKSIIRAVDLLGTALRGLPDDDVYEPIKLAWTQLIMHFLVQLRGKLAPPAALNIRRRWHRHLPRTIDSFDDEVIPQTFRFRSKADLHALFVGFQLPLEAVISGHVFYGEEMLLVTSVKLHEPRCLNDKYFVDEFDLRYSSVSMVYNFVINWLVLKWGYLLLDNMDYWKPLIPTFAEKIRLKAQTAQCPFPSAYAPEGFKIFGFLDDTVTAICRPGGGPLRDGPNAPRNAHELQQDYYSKHKHRHGIKWQTVDLPNGKLSGH